MPKEELAHSISSILFIVLVLAGFLLILNFTFRPATLLEKSRDAHRIEDLQDLVNATNLYLADNKNFDALKTDQVYSSNLGDREINAQGWLPIDFQSISSGVPIAQLPLDPINDLNFNYQFGVNVANKTYEIDCVIESGSNQKKMLEDGGNNPARYELGTDLTILK